MARAPCKIQRLRVIILWHGGIVMLTPGPIHTRNSRFIERSAQWNIVCVAAYNALPWSYAGPYTERWQHADSEGD